MSFAINELIKFAEGLETPHILCGDFNQEPHFPGYQLLYDGRLNNAMTKYLRTFDKNYEDNKVNIMLRFSLHRCIQIFTDTTK